MYWAEFDGLAVEGEVYRPVNDRCLSGVSAKSRLTATLLVLLLGQFGAHRFYTGKIETALSMLVLAIPSWLTPWYPLGWLFALPLIVWILIDSVLVISGQMQDVRGNLIKKW